MTVSSTALRRKGAHITDDQIQDFVVRRLRGETLKEIADLYHTTPQYVYALTRMGATPEKYAAAMGRSASMTIDNLSTLTAAINEWLTERGTATVTEVLTRFKLTTHQWQLIRPHIDQSRVISRTTKAPYRLRYSNDAAIKSIRRVFKAVGKEKGRLTSQMYEANRNKETDPSVPTIHNRFGSWALACAAAKVPSGHRGDVRSEWSDDDLLNWLARWHHTLAADVRPSYVRYDAWQRENVGAPSGSLLRVRLKQYGTWAAIVRTALAQENTQQQ